jgi:uncharacterized protein YgiB involved in biofilm formation
MKRSKSVQVLMLSAAALSLAACKEDKIQAQAFPNVEACLADAAKSSSWYTEAECRSNFAQAEAEHDRTAPRYADAALCEEQHGGECVAQPATAGGGSSVFLPLMAGYMIGNMMGNNSGLRGSQPLYSTSTGKYSTANGSAILNSNRGTTQMAQSSFRSASPTKTAAPMTRTSVKSTGGFGSARTSTAGRSFGG